MKTFSRYLKEAYLINLIHDNNVLVLKMKESGKKGWVEVRGKKGYDDTGYDKNDKLHKILDSLDGATVSRLMAGDEVTLNPRNPRAASSIKVVKKILK